MGISRSWGHGPLAPPSFTSPPPPLSVGAIYALNTTVYFSLNKLETTPLEYSNSFKTFETYTDLFNLNNKSLYIKDKYNI